MTRPGNTTAALLDALASLDTVEQLRNYRLTTVAQAVGVSHQTVRGWADRNRIRTVRNGNTGERYVPLAEVQRLASEGWSINIDALLDEK